MEIIKIASLCILSAVLCKMFNRDNEEFGIYIKLAAAAGIMSAVILYAAPVIENVNEIFARTGTDTEYLNILFKALGICYVTQFAYDICRDSGENTLASQVELAGKLSLTFISLPLVKELTDIVITLAGN